MAKKKRVEASIPKELKTSLPQSDVLGVINIPDSSFLQRSINGILPKSVLLESKYLTSDYIGDLSSIGKYTIPDIEPSSFFKLGEDYWKGVVTIPKPKYESFILEQELDNEIDDLKRENRKFSQEVADKSAALKKKEIKIDELNETIKQLYVNEQEMSQKQRLQHLLYRVDERAWDTLVKNEEFRKQFEHKTPCLAVIMAIDIRRSTELMLKAKDADSYQRFIIGLCMQLKQIITSNYGVFDKFTGDGILAFFPEFFSGDDAMYFAIKAAGECHAYFSAHYDNNRNCFTTVLYGIGLGIGIDYGESHLVHVEDWVTVIGRPVVYACRLSAAKAGITLLNQHAYEIASNKFGAYIDFAENVLDIKNEGEILTYIAATNKKTPEVKLPSWLSPHTSKKT